MTSPRRSFPRQPNRRWSSGNGAFAWAWLQSSISQISSNGPLRTSARGSPSSIGTLSFRRSANLPTVPTLPGPKPATRSSGDCARSILRVAVAADVTSFCTGLLQEGLSKSDASCTTAWTYSATFHLPMTRAGNSGRPARYFCGCLPRSQISSLRTHRRNNDKPDVPKAGARLAEPVRHGPDQLDIISSAAWDVVVPDRLAPSRYQRCCHPHRRTDGCFLYFRSRRHLPASQRLCQDL